MKTFFVEGGWGMFPVLLVGLVVLYASIRYLVDGEPVRLRFILALSLAQLALVTQAHHDLGVQVHFAGIISDAHLIGIGEDPAFNFVAVNAAGHVVGPQHDILAGNDDGAAVGRR